MRLPRFVLALAMIGTPVLTVAVTASSASAQPLTYSSVSVSHRVACALSTDGRVVCWGDNTQQWLTPTRPAGPVPTPTMISLPNGQRWKSINVGDAYSNCGLSENDRAWCWGEHHIGSFFTTQSRVPVEVEFPANVRLLEVQSGTYTGCATTTARELWCWGDAHYIGDGNIDPVRVPVRVPMPDNSTVESFNMGIGGICVITSSQRMYCWGDNSSGQFGLGYQQPYRYTHSWTPVLVPAPQGEVWAKASVSLNRICALTVSGKGYCAGDNYDGAFGDGTYDDSMRFRQMQVPDNERVTTIEAGWYHTCIFTESGKTWCLGRGDYGELGSGTTLGGRIWRAPLVAEGVRFSSIAAGIAGTCGLQTNGRVWCWGGLNWGSQGTGAVNATLFPALIAQVGAPSISPLSTTNLDAESATINGGVNPNGYQSTVVLEIGTTADFTGATRRTVTNRFPADSYVPTVFSLPLADLAPRTTYHARVLATNTFGTVTGSAFTFVTLGSEPEVSGVTASAVTGNEATVTASVHPNRLATSARFEYSTDPTFTAAVQSAPVEQALGNVNQSRETVLENLTPNTQYHVRVVATNRLGTTVGTASSFTTIGSLPSVSAVSTSATSREITVSFTVDPGFARGEVVVEHSTSSSFTNAVRSAPRTFSSRGTQPLTLSVAGLQPRTDYWVRVVATNGVGTTTSAAVVQRTRGGKPVVSIPSVVPNGRTATVNVAYETTGLDTQVVLQVSRNPDMSNATEYFVASDSSDGTVTVPVQVVNLSPRVAYYAIARATNVAGTTFTPTTTFVMPSLVGVLINDDDESTTSATVTLSVTAAPGALAYRVANNALFNNAKVFPAVSPLRWELLASEGGEVERTVFVQVIYRQGVATFSDSIILITESDSPDEDAPVIEDVEVSRASATAQGRVTAAAAVRHISITTRDRRSGVTRIEVRAAGRRIVARVDAQRRGTHSVALPRGSRTAQVRVRDAAGNFSQWRTVRVS